MAVEYSQKVKRWLTTTQICVQPLVILRGRLGGRSYVVRVLLRVAVVFPVTCRSASVLNSSLSSHVLLYPRPAKKRKICYPLPTVLCALFDFHVPN